MTKGGGEEKEGGGKKEEGRKGRGGGGKTKGGKRRREEGEGEGGRQGKEGSRSNLRPLLFWKISGSVKDLCLGAGLDRSSSNLVYFPKAPPVVLEAQGHRRLLSGRTIVDSGSGNTA